MQIDKLAAATSIVFSVAIAAPLVALASNGSDDPAGQHRDGRDVGARAAAIDTNASVSGALTLRGSVGPAFAIALTRNGQKVRSLRAGTYRFVIADRASIHNFVLEKERGGHFERELTDVSDVGTKTVTIKLTRGSWKYDCEAHESVMFGSFTVR